MHTLLSTWLTLDAMVYDFAPWTPPSGSFWFVAAHPRPSLWGVRPKSMMGVVVDKEVIGTVVGWFASLLSRASLSSPPRSFLPLLSPPPPLPLLHFLVCPGTTPQNPEC